MNKNKVVMAGTGIMGASLCQVYALAGYETWGYNTSEAGIENGKHRIALNQETMVKEGLITQEESDAAVARIHFTQDKEVFGCCVVVESIVERMDIKQGFFREISEIAPKEALLCTNTSGLHITEIAEACKYPERFMGQHWLNPPHLLPLCEIIAGAKTSSENVQKMRELVKGLGKQPVVVGDINGFIINRIQFAVLREACIS
jgi:3-hydroxybutyryl-CoA dehydrogenase